MPIWLPLLLAQLALPPGLYVTAIAADGAGNLFILDRGQSVLEVDSTGALRPLVSTLDEDVSRIAVGPDGTIFATESGGHTGSNFLDALAAGANGFVHLAGSPGFACGSARPDVCDAWVDSVKEQFGHDGIGQHADFLLPAGMAIGGDGIIFVADSGDHSVRRVIRRTGAVTTLAGKAGASGDADGRGQAARFGEPLALALDGAGHLYVADAKSRSIRRIDLRTKTVTTLPTGELTQRIEPRSDRLTIVHPEGDPLVYPCDLAWSRTGDLFIADGARVRRLSLRTSALSDVSSVADWQPPLLQELASGADGGVQLRGIPVGPPACLAVDDAHGWLYVARGPTIERVSLSTGTAELFATSRHRHPSHDSSQPRQGHAASGSNP